MRQLVEQFLGSRISRRTFVQALAGLGVSAAGVESVVHAAEASVKGAAPGTGWTVNGTGGDLMVAQMQAAGVKFVFTNPGSFEVGFFDAFLNQPMQLIVGLHEGLVISMADGYHKISGEPAFVNIHVIAGTAQAAGQMYNASRDGSALVVTAGLLDNEIFSDDVLLGPRPGFDQKEVNRQFTKISWETHEPRAVPTMIRRAFKVAATAPGGPVYLALPNYVLEAKDVSADIYNRENFMIPYDIPPNEDQVNQVAKLLLEAKSPVLYLNHDVAKAGAQAAVLELAELLAIPVSDGGLSGYHSFPHRHPLFGGSTRGSDLVINIGGNDQGGGTVPRRATYEDGTTVVRIGLDTNAIGRNNPFHYAMIAHPRMAAEALTAAVKSMATEERLEKIRSSRPERPSRSHDVRANNIGLSPMHPDVLGHALEEELDKNAIVVSENLSGSNQFFSTGFREDEKTWVGTSGAGLGWGIGAANGAKLAAPDRQVVCNIGDGAVMYSASGFWTQARYELPVLTVVCNNRDYQTVRNAYYRYNGKMREADRYTGMHLGDPNIDFVKLAESQGVAGIKVDNEADLRPAIKRGIDATREGRPFLIDVEVRKTGGGRNSEWFQAYSPAGGQTEKV